MKKYYSDLEAKLGAGDYEAAAKFVDKSKDKYGEKNILLYYLDSGMVNHLAKKYKESIKSFESAKDKFNEYYQKSIAIGAASIVFNDSAMPYYGENYERIHINVFEALNYILESDKNEAAVEARQANVLFKIFAVEKNYKNFYNDDGFVRYFMGLVYENAGYLNDAHVSYYLALKAYENGLACIIPPQDLINDAYTTALIMEMPGRAAEIKSNFPDAKEVFVPKGHGELIIIDYNGVIAQKIDDVFDIVLSQAWVYVDNVEVDSDEKEEFDKAKSVVISAFAKDYIKVVFPKYKRVVNDIKSFFVTFEGKSTHAYEAQNFTEIAEKCLKNDIAKVFAKTVARAAVKYVIGKSVSKVVEDNTKGSGWGSLTQAGFNIFNSLTAEADKRSWRTLPENILMARAYLPAGENKITINFLGVSGEILSSEKITVNIQAGKKTFKVLRITM
ncbi:MAG: hypothetical protein LBD46_03760 [Endomicrobium sp.]|jgi:hypothetical protein|nr:hypothetical protein [Endomicrobium sp.]